MKKNEIKSSKYLQIMKAGSPHLLDKAAFDHYIYPVTLSTGLILMAETISGPYTDVDGLTEWYDIELSRSISVKDGENFRTQLLNY